MLTTEDDEKAEPSNGTHLHGLATSSGQYTESARIVMSEAESGNLQAGDVLVCPTTQPLWSVLFPSVNALVTDFGDILSHPTIVTREYTIPAVVATSSGTTLLKYGQAIIVDGYNGIVKIV